MGEYPKSRRQQEQNVTIMVKKNCKNFKGIHIAFHKKSP